MSVDTLTLAQRLRAAELPPTQAEAIAAAIGAAVLDGAATKEDLGAVKAELKSDIVALKSEIAALKSELKGDIAALRGEVDGVRAGLELKIEQTNTAIERSRNQILIGFVSTQIAFAGTIIAAIKLF